MGEFPVTPLIVTAKDNSFLADASFTFSFSTNEHQPRYITLNTRLLASGFPPTLPLHSPSSRRPKMEWEPKRGVSVHLHFARIVVYSF